MTISVVIPVYNEEKRILDTLKAIYDGSEMPREVIVVDGCSTDRTVNIIKENFPEIIVLNNPGRTAAAGRNIGIKKAKGDIIAFTDGDCIVANNWIENIV